MKSKADWTSQAKGLLKGELKRRNVSYQALSDSLGTLGVNDSPENIANKISRGKFPAVFFLQCMEAIGVKTIHLDDAA
jgi:hypothetical protein